MPPRLATSANEQTYWSKELRKELVAPSLTCFTLAGNAGSSPGLPKKMTALDVALWEASVGSLKSSEGAPQDAGHEDGKGDSCMASYVNVVCRWRVYRRYHAVLSGCSGDDAILRDVVSVTEILRGLPSIAPEQSIRVAVCNIAREVLPVLQQALDTLRCSSTACSSQTWHSVWSGLVQCLRLLHRCSCEAFSETAELLLSMMTLGVERRFLTPEASIEHVLALQRQDDGMFKVVVWLALARWLASPRFSLADAATQQESVDSKNMAVLVSDALKAALTFAADDLPLLVPPHQSSSDAAGENGSACHIWSSLLSPLLRLVVAHPSALDANVPRESDAAGFHFVSRTFALCKSSKSMRLGYDLWAALTSAAGALDERCELQAFISGVALVQLGHLVESCVDWSLDRHEEVKIIVKHAQSMQETLVAHASPSDRIIKKLHEGIRLSFKSYVRSRNFTDVVELWETMPYIGVSHEVSMAKLALGEPEQAADISLMLYEQLAASFAASKSHGIPTPMSKYFYQVMSSTGRLHAKRCLDDVELDRNAAALDDLLSQINRDKNHSAGSSANAQETSLLPAGDTLLTWLSKTLRCTAAVGLSSAVALESYVAGLSEFWDNNLATSRCVLRAVMHAAASATSSRANRRTSVVGVTRSAFCAFLRALFAVLRQVNKTTPRKKNEAQLLCCVVAHFDALYPRLCSWALAVEFFAIDMRQSDLAVACLEYVLSASGTLNTEAAVPALDARTNAVMRILEELSPSAIHALLPSVLRQDSRCVLSKELAGLLEWCLEHKVNLAFTTASWTCSFCRTVCPSSMASCGVCSALRLAVWQCKGCGGFSPTSQQHECQLCGQSPTEAVGGDAAIDSAKRVFPLRAWSCKSCRCRNSATQIFYCSTCKEPSHVAKLTKALTPMLCDACGHHNPLGILQPWCVACGATHPSVQKPMATLWSCRECYQWNPWVATHCRECHSSKPHTAAGEVIVPWFQQSCSACDASMPAWSSRCGCCGTALANGDPCGEVEHHAKEVDAGDVVVCEGSSILQRRTDTCGTCGTPLASGIDACLSCGAHARSRTEHDSAEGAQPVLWVCLRGGCLTINAPAQAKCMTCGTSKGLTTSASSHTNVFAHVSSQWRKRFRPHERSTVSTAVVAAESADDEQLSVLAMSCAPESLTASAVDLYSDRLQTCANCGELCHLTNIALICGNCAASCWTPFQRHAELSMWLMLRACDAITVEWDKQRHRAPEDTNGPLRPLRAVTDCMMRATPSQLPWRGRDMKNMRCSDVSSVPVHEPEGTPHSALQAVSSLIDRLSHISRSAPGVSEAVAVLLVALDWLDVVNRTTDFDEITFDVLCGLTQAIQRASRRSAERTAPRGSADDDAIQLLDKLRLEYLIQTKLSSQFITVDALGLCRWCLSPLHTSDGAQCGHCSGTGRTAVADVAPPTPDPSREQTGLHQQRYAQQPAVTALQHKSHAAGGTAYLYH